MQLHRWAHNFLTCGHCDQPMCKEIAEIYECASFLRDFNVVAKHKPSKGFFALVYLLEYSPEKFKEQVLLNLSFNLAWRTDFLCLSYMRDLKYFFWDCGSAVASIRIFRQHFSTIYPLIDDRQLTLPT